MRHVTAAVAMFLVTTACSETIQHGLDERQANEIQSVLVERGLQAGKVVEPGKKPTWSIEVPEEQSTDAVRILSELGLPRPQAEDPSELFGKSLVPSPTEERALYLEWISRKISRSLESLDGVTAASVLLVIPPPPRPGAPPVPAKASAFLKVRPGMVDRVNRMKDDLRALVAGGVENLSPDEVTLVVSEVATTVHSRPAAPERRPSLLVAVAGLGATVTLLSLGLVWLALRLRRERARTEALRRPQPPPARGGSASPGTMAVPARKVA